jgi:outer membrane protein TolC
MAFIVLSGCARFASFTRTRADNAAYGVIAQKQTKVLGEAEPFSVYPGGAEALDRLTSAAQRLDLSVEGYTTPTYTLSLADALAIAFANSRSYQDQKETLFSQALSTLDVRYNFGLQYTATGELDYEHDHSSGSGGAATTDEKFATRNAAVSVQQKLFTGATISLGFVHNFVRSFTSEPGTNATNSLAFNFVQPLLNGAGPLVALEPLHQSERNMIYAVRTFKRAQGRFAIDTIAAYFALLQSLDGMRNQYQALRSAQWSAERSKAWAEAGRLSTLEADQAQQKVLAAESAWISRQAAYLNQLDAFKVRLGLPVNLSVGPDPQELIMLAERGRVLPALTLEEALDAALADRLDLKTTADQVEDQRRDTEIALRNFLPNLDAGYSRNLSRSGSQSDQGLNFSSRSDTSKWSLSLGLPLDWTPRRDAYRNQVLALAKSERTLGQNRDNAVLDVKRIWRDLNYQNKNFDIQQESVRLAERLLESATLLQELGRATQRDMDEARDANTAARDALTAATVSYTIDRLEFWYAVERLKIDPKNMWYE